MSKTVSAKVTIANRLGLHARPAMIFVEVASRFDTDISIRRTDQSEQVDGKSIMQLMMLAATQGTELELVASGLEAQKAIDELVLLVKSNFNED